MKNYKLFQKLCIVFIVCTPLAYCVVLPMIPELHDITDISSPDGKWTARRALHAYASMFSPPEYVIIILPAGSWFSRFRGDKICVINAESNNLPPKIEWRNDHELVVHITGMTHADGIYLQVPEYRGIKISYDFQIEK